MKMHIRFNYLLMLLIFFLVSCGSKNVSPELQTLMDEVMEIHDAVMPKMSDTHRLKKALKKELKNNIEEVSETRGLLLEHHTALEKADDGMMDWMRDYKKLRKLEEGTDAMAYYNSEKIKIQKVSDDMLSAIANAEAFLKNLEQK